MAMDFSQYLSGLEDGRRRQVAAAAHAVDVFADHVVGDAQQLTPVDTGALQASGTTLPIEVDGEEISKTIGFNTTYAAAVHENLSAHHDVGQAKYLSAAIEGNASKLGPFVANAIKAAT